MPVYLTEYAVRVKGTQEYLPRPQRRDGRGGSHLEPIDFSKAKEHRGVSSRYAQDMQIRSYATERAAKNLLSSWLTGKYYGDQDGDIWNKPVVERKAEHMEIVKITIVLPD